MHKSARITAILSEDLVLAVFAPGPLPKNLEPGQAFTVFEEVEFDAATAQLAGVPIVQVPKGTLRFSAMQPDARHGLFTRVAVVHSRKVPRPGPLQEFLTASGVFGARSEDLILEPVVESVTLKRQAGLNLHIGPIQVGDYLCSNQ
jgi:hypothetical protein